MTDLVVTATDAAGNKVAKTVSFTQVRPQPVGRLHSVYYMMWSNSGSPPFTALPPKFNQVRYAFAQTQGDGHLRLVGSGSQSMDALKIGNQTFRSSGRTALVSIGGQAGAVDTSNTTRFIDDVLTIDAQLGGVDGIDWDVEASALNQTNVVTINRELFRQKPNWRAISFAPNGGNVGQYLTVAVATYRAGIPIQYGQQFYDATVSYDDMHWRIQQAITAGVPVGSICIGMMQYVPGASSYGSDHYWDVDTCVSRLQAALKEWPTLLGGYYWEASRIGRTQDSATYPDRVGTALGL